MSHWEWPGLFSIEVPGTWQVHDLPGLIEITPPQGNGALHISVLNRTKAGEVTPDEASTIVEASPARQSLPTINVIALQQNAAEAEFVDKTGMAWLVRVKVSQARAIVSTFSYARDEALLRQEALASMQSIEITE